MDSTQINNGIKDVGNESLKILRYNTDDASLANAINEVSKEDLERCWSYYKDRSGVIVDVRKDLIRLLLEGEKVTADVLNSLVNEHKAGKENQFRVYKKLYAIFYPLITFYGHNKLRKFIESFIEKLIEDLGVSDVVKSVYFDFQGARQQGSDRLWIAVYNKSQVYQASSLQLFIEFFKGTVSYGIYRHSDKTYLSPPVIIDTGAFDYDEMLAYLHKNMHLVVNDTNVTNDETIVKSVDREDGQNALNQILYGPPGTGKTYHTINKAVSIIEGKAEGELESEPRDRIKLRYQGYVEQERIVFTTFHQSMSYEDFVEGIKPTLTEDEDGNKQVIYERVSGVFKRIVEKALENSEVSRNVGYSFDDGWTEIIASANKSLENGKQFKLPILTPDMGMLVTDITPNGNLRVKPSNMKGNEYTVSYSRAKKLQEAFPNLSAVKNMDRQFREVIGGMNSTAFWAVLNFINNKISSHGEKLTSELNTGSEPYVLIIDEINRGNVSAIFGELITLIEESKRAGTPEALEVTLPYSDSKFSIPRNVYIIGTMNTADRSVESLDSALRRRFVFKEMLPRLDLPELNYNVFEYTAAAILMKINSRVEKLLDRDHCIGHSYFIGKDESTIIEVIYRNIIPLLQEYFYGDYGKIGLVLGSGFIRKKESKGKIFADFEYDYSSDLEDRQVYEIIDYFASNDPEGFSEAISLLMN